MHFSYDRIVYSQNMNVFSCPIIFVQSRKLQIIVDDSPQEGQMKTFNPDFLRVKFNDRHKRFTISTYNI